MNRRGRPPHPDVLTPREWEVLALLREGLSDQAIGERLGISLDGAKYHVREILSKLGVSSRQEAAAWRPKERAPAHRWVTLPLAARIGAALVIVAAVTGLGLLAWGVLRTDGPSDEPTGSITPTASAALANCKDGAPTLLDGLPACSFTFKVNDVPARLQGFPLQVSPQRTNIFGDVQILATCTPAGGCLGMATGDPVTEERTSQIDWRIETAATIVITSPETVTPDGIPARKYHLVGFAYDHPAERICTGEFLYCYNLVANYDRIE